jgi:hypothetical protein
MYTQMKKRCFDFARTTDLKTSNAASLYYAAARDGNVEAVARELKLDATNIPSDQLKSKVVSVLASKDPGATFELSDLFGKDSPFAMTPNMEVGAPESRFAWMLVACDQGLDCSATSSIVQQMCLFGGICGTGGLRENIQESGAAPAKYAQILAAEGSINSAIGKGAIASLINIQ